MFQLSNQFTTGVENSNWQRLPTRQGSAGNSSLRHSGKSEGRSTVRYNRASVNRIWQFIRAVFSTWASGLTGGASAPLAVLALVVNDAIQKRIFAVFAIIFVAVAAFLVWLREVRQREAFEKRFAGLPKLKLAPAGFYTDMRTLRIREGTVQGNFVRLIERPISCIHCRFINDPEVSTPESLARDVTATLEYRNKEDRTLFILDGRWGDTDQPQPGQNTIALLSVDFRIGQTREVNLAFKHPEEEECHGLNNDSYGRPDWKDPRWRLDGTDFSVTIRLRGPYIDNRWRVRFRNPGAGREFETVGFEILN
jgi:hypothetical protein